MSVTSGQIEYVLNKLYNDRTNRGLLVHHRLAEAQQEVQECRYRADEFFDAIADWIDRQRQGNGARRASRDRRQSAQPGAGATGRARSRTAPRRCPRRSGTTSRAAAERLQALAHADRRLAHASGRARRVYWIDATRSRRGRRAAAPGGGADRRRPGPARAALRQGADGRHDQRHAGRRPRRLVRFFQVAGRADAGRLPPLGQPVRLSQAGRADPARRHARPDDRQATATSARPSR